MKYIKIIGAFFHVFSLLCMGVSIFAHFAHWFAGREFWMIFTMLLIACFCTSGAGYYLAYNGDYGKALTDLWAEREAYEKERHKLEMLQQKYVREFQAKGTL